MCMSSGGGSFNPIKMLRPIVPPVPLIPKPLRKPLGVDKSESISADSKFVQSPLTFVKTPLSLFGKRG